MSNSQAKKIILLNAIYISGLIFFFLPSEIYVGNPREFISTPIVLTIKLLLAGLAFTVGLILPALIPSQRWRKVYGTLLGGAFLALWVSGVFLVGDFGEFDGTSFDLSRHTRMLTIQGVWLTIAFTLVCLGIWKWPTHLFHVTGVIGIGLFIIGTVNFYKVSSTANAAWEPINLRNFTRFSTERNLIIVLMDTFQSDVLQQIVDQQPSIRNEMDGFWFYPDTMGVAPSTYLTMPAFHSGKIYNNLIPLAEYYDLGVRDGSFLVDLARNGYQVDVINPITGVCPSGASSCNRQESLLLHADDVTDSEASRLADLGILRVAPGLLKQWVFDGTSGPITRLQDQKALSGLSLRVYQGNTVLKLIAENLWASDTAPTAKLIHLFNTHPPYMFDRDCKFIGIENAQDRDHMTMQSECAMRWFIELLVQMKRVGIYENSMIILTADTGAGTVYGADDLSSKYALAHGSPPSEFGRLVGGANPVLAIKFPGSNGPMQNSAIQAQLTDIPRTVCENLPGCTNSEGINLRADEAVIRERIYKYYRWKNEFWSLNHIPGIIHYNVKGPLWLESSWSRKFSDKMPIEISKVDFSSEDDAELFGMGWSHVEVNKAGISKRWSIAKKAELFLPLPSGQDLTLQFEVMSAPGLIDQVMVVKVDGEVVGSRSLGDKVHVVTLNVPARLVTRRISEVTIEFAKLKLPTTPDRRRVSVSFFQLKVFQTPDS